MLSSWKEIAQFFGKGVRTVQRWEKTLELPVRRPSGASSNVVLARTSDLEQWMHRGRGAAVEGMAAEAGDDAEVRASLEQLESEVAVLAAKLHVEAAAVHGSSAPERIGAIRSTISRLTDVATLEQPRRAA